jgi:hypothetical protein
MSRVPQTLVVPGVGHPAPSVGKLEHNYNTTKPDMRAWGFNGTRPVSHHKFDSLLLVEEDPFKVGSEELDKLSMAPLDEMERHDEEPACILLNSITNDVKHGNLFQSEANQSHPSLFKSLPTPEHNTKPQKPQRKLS